MPTYHPALETAELLDWPAIRATDVPWRSLLIGNGASIAVAESFSYSSLLQVSAGQGIDHPLEGSAQELFNGLGTTNFEFVLASLKLAGRVCEATGVEAPPLPQLYRLVQQALFEAVGEVHVPWEAVVGQSLERIRGELIQYKSVFSTNYDLLIYWSMLHEGDPDDFRDFFWHADGSFDAANFGGVGTSHTDLLPPRRNPPTQDTDGRDLETAR